MSVYYNENDPFAADWLRGLILEGLIPPGDVDERSIQEVAPDDLKGYTQCHFFAGIGGWAYALRLAGWPDDRPVWTGSCPCQPFSSAGKRGGVDDERHLWPDWRWLIDQCRPARVFGEQVASKAGRAWLAGVQTDLEAMGYGTAAADLCAAGVGAPHIRQRLWWVADTSSERRQQERGPADNGGMGDSSLPGLQERKGNRRVQRETGQSSEGQAVELPGNPWQNAAWILCADGKARRIEPGLEPLVDGIPCRVGRLRGYGNAIVPQVAAEFIQAVEEALEVKELLA